jgi:hypothetical protein
MPVSPERTVDHADPCSHHCLPERGGKAALAVLAIVLIIAMAAARPAMQAIEVAGITVGVTPIMAVTTAIAFVAVAVRRHQRERQALRARTVRELPAARAQAIEAPRPVHGSFTYSRNRRRPASAWTRANNERVTFITAPGTPIRGCLANRAEPLGVRVQIPWLRTGWHWPIAARVAQAGGSVRVGQLRRGMRRPWRMLRVPRTAQPWHSSYCVERVGELPDRPSRIPRGRHREPECAAHARKCGLE